MTEKIPFEAHAGFDVSTQTTTEITDHKNFAPMTNKIETIGKIFRKTFAVVCDGHGHMMFIRLGGQSLRHHEITNSLRELKDTLDNGAISQNDYEEVRKNIVDELKKLWNH